MKFKSEVQLEALNNATVDTDKFLVSDSTTVKYRTGAQLLSDLGVSGIYVPYTGATGNVDLGTHTLLAKDLIINHSSGSGVAASITKNGSGEALTVIKGSGSGNAMSVTGGLTSLVDLTLSSIPNATIDTNRFIVSDSGAIKYRTGAEVLSDIGAQAALTNPITGTGTTNYVSKFTGSTTLGDSQLFDNGTNVGIGTNSPTATLQINGAGGDSAPTLRLISAASDTFNWASDTRYANLTAGETSIHLIGKANSQYNQAYFGYRHTSDGSASNMLTLGLYASDNLLNILGNGNVGIGTTTPSAKLDVRGDSGTSLRISSNDNYHIGALSWEDGTITLAAGGYGSPDLRFSTAGSEKMRITNAGNVGIGTTSPTFVTTGTTVLDVNGSTGAAIYLRANIAQGSYLRQTSNDLLIGNNTYGDIIYNTGFSEAMRVTVDRLVGIGTTTPSAKLQINAFSWALGGNDVSRMLQKSIGVAGDYEQHVILLHPIYNGSLIAYNKCSGSIYASRGGVGSGLINDTYNIDTASAYNTYNGTINSTIGYGRLYTCDYNGVKYLALLPDYRTSAVQYNFDGYIKSTGEELKLVVYRMSNSGTIINSEINNSLTIFNAGVTYYQGDLGIKGAILDSSNSPGTSGQVLSSTGSGTAWTTGGGGGSQDLQQVTDVGNTTMNPIFFNGNVPMYGIYNSPFLGSDVLPNGNDYPNASNETTVGVYDINSGLFETGLYCKRLIPCNSGNSTNILTVFNSNSCVDFTLNVRMKNVEKTLITKGTLSINWIRGNYTYRITNTNTTSKDDSETVLWTLNFEFDGSGTFLSINFINNSVNDCYASINANIS